MYSYFTLSMFEIKELLLLTVQYTHQDLVKFQMILKPFCQKKFLNN